MPTRTILCLEISTGVFFCLFVITSALAIDAEIRLRKAQFNESVYRERLSIAYGEMAKMPPGVAKAYQRKIATMEAAGETVKKLVE